MPDIQSQLQFVDPKLEGQLAARSLVRGMLWVTLAICVVVPHSFQLFTLLMMSGTFVLSLVVMKRDPWFDRVLLTYMLGAIVTAVYIWVGYMNGAPKVASNQTLLVYLVAPLVWMVLSTVIFQLFGIERTVRMLIQFTFAAVASVILFFYMFLTFGPDSVKFLTEEANVYVAEGFAGATILVYGSLIFLSGALFAQPMLIKNSYARLGLLTMLVLCALTSGRSALILSIPAGFVAGTLARSRLRRDTPAEQRRSVLWPMIGLGLAATAAFLAINYLFFEVDLSVVLGEFFDELLSGGGSVRTDQAAALWDGFLDSRGIGIGHGVGVAFIRNTDFPWRYEVIPLATLVRVGVVGTLAYMSTFLLYGAAFLRQFRRRDLTPQDVYMVGGFFAVSLAAFTNPYIESFIFQWMYFLPALSIAVQPLGARPAATALSAEQVEPA